MVDDHRVAGEGQLCGQHHHAVCRGAAGLAGNGVELCGVGAAALPAVDHPDLTVIHQCGVAFHRVHKAALPELFPGRCFVQAPDRIAELGVRRFRCIRLRLHIHRAEISGQHDDAAADRLAVHRDVHLMPAGGSVVSRRDIGPPAIRCTHALHIAEVRFHRGGRITGHAGNAQAHHAALLYPLGRKLCLCAGLQGEPEGITVPAGGLCGLFQPQIPAHSSGAAALELHHRAALRHPPDGQFSLVFAIGREQKALVFTGCAREHRLAGSRPDGQGGVDGPVRQGEGRVGRVQGAQLLHREGRRAGEHLIQLSADQRHLPAGSVALQCFGAELRRAVRAAALGGKGVAYSHHRPQKHPDAQHHTHEPEQKTLHDVLLPQRCFSASRR